MFLLLSQKIGTVDFQLPWHLKIDITCSLFFLIRKKKFYNKKLKFPSDFSFIAVNNFLPFHILQPV